MERPESEVVLEGSDGAEGLTVGVEVGLDVAVGVELVGAKVDGAGPLLGRATTVVEDGFVVAAPVVDPATDPAVDPATDPAVDPVLDDVAWDVGEELALPWWVPEELADGVWTPFVVAVGVAVARGEVELAGTASSWRVPEWPFRATVKVAATRSPATPSATPSAG